MSRVLSGVLLGCTVLSGGCATWAQAGGQNAVVPQDPGYATGHVVCSDTQRPARLAQVRFVPLPTAARAATDVEAPKSKMSGLETSQVFGAELNPVETDMDGAYTVRNLKPGRYVVRVDLGGYLTPLLAFPAGDFRNPDEAARQRMSRELQIVDIHPRAETRADVTLQRGATVSGTVLYDDGSPAIAVATQLLVKNAKGEWEESHLTGLSYGSTDAGGRYAIQGVPPGDYLVRANLSLNEFSNSIVPMNGDEIHVLMSKTIFSLPVYSGSVLRRRDAVPIKVEDAAILDGNDLTLPISKLHSVSGAIVAEGHPLNGGKVVLRYPDDKTEVVSVDVTRDDRQFHFPYVPEGSYTLAVEDAREVTEVEVPNAPGAVPKSHTEEKTLRKYGKLEQPLVVQSDVEGVLATVPDEKDKSSVAGTQTPL